MEAIKPNYGGKPPYYRFRLTRHVRDEEGRLLRDKGRIRERWVRFFRSLLNSKSDMLDPDNPKRLPQPVASALGIEPTEEIATVTKALANAKAVGPDGLPSELLKLGFQQVRTIPLGLHRLTTLIWREGKVPQQWKDAVITVPHDKDGVWKLPWHLARVTRG